MSVIFVVFHSRPPFNVAVPHGLVTTGFSCCKMKVGSHNKNFPA